MIRAYSCLLTDCMISMLCACLLVVFGPVKCFAKVCIHEIAVDVQISVHPWCSCM